VKHGTAQDLIMAGKHQIYSSNKKTRAKATRKWRRQAKQHDQQRAAEPDMPYHPPNPSQKKVAAKKRMSRALEEFNRTQERTERFGTNLGELLKDTTEDDS
jgi:hypothetical protein